MDSKVADWLEAMARVEEHIELEADQTNGEIGFAQGRSQAFRYIARKVRDSADLQFFFEPGDLEVMS